MHSWSNSRRQTVYRLAYSLVEVAQALSVRSPVKGLTDIGTVQHKFYTLKQKNVPDLRTWQVINVPGSYL